ALKAAGGAFHAGGELDVGSDRQTERLVAGLRHQVEFHAGEEIGQPAVGDSAARNDEKRGFIVVTRCRSAGANLACGEKSYAPLDPVVQAQSEREGHVEDSKIPRTAIVLVDSTHEAEFAPTKRLSPGNGKKPGCAVDIRLQPLDPLLVLASAGIDRS